MMNTVVCIATIGRRITALLIGEAEIQPDDIVTVLSQDGIDKGTMCSFLGDE